jgi:hypothetical protein
MADILKHASSSEQIETLMGDEFLTEPAILDCAGCHRPCAINAAFETPKGPMCRTCRNATYGEPTTETTNRCPVRPDRSHDISMRGSDGTFRCWHCAKTRQQIEAER